MGILRDLFPAAKALDIARFPADMDRAQRVPTNADSIDYWSPIPIMDAPSPLLAYDPGAVTPASLWRSQPNVRKVVDFIARNVASIPLHVYERHTDTDRARVRDGALAEVLAAPRPRTAPFRFWYGVMHDGLLYDRWAVHTSYDRTGRLVLNRVPASRLKFDTDALGRVTRARFYASASTVAQQGDDGWVDLDLDELIFDHGYGPTGEAGVSPMVTLADVLAESSEAVGWRRQVWKNGARISGWIERGVDPEIPDWDEDERQRFLDKFDADFRGNGPRAGGWPLVEDGMKLHQFNGGFTPQDTQDIEGRRLSAIEVAAAFHIAPELVGAQQGNYSNVREYRQMLYRDSLGPHITALEQALNAQLVPIIDDPRPLYVEANVEAKLRGSFEEQAVVTSQAVGGPWMTRNEARAKQNMPAIAGGDELIVPLNLGTPGQEMSADELKKLTDAVGTLIRSGYDPVDALTAVGLDPIKHLGLLPVTVQRPQEPENVDTELVNELQNGDSTSPGEESL